jgi:hypothetical protein
MHPWLVWIYWINPLSYGFESLMANEFRDTIIPCASQNLVPSQLPEYHDAAHQSCAGIAGAVPGATVVSGEDYLAGLSYSPSNIWRNVGILIAWWLFFVGLTIFFVQRWNDAAGSGGALLIPRENQKKSTQRIASDEEAQSNEKHSQTDGSLEDAIGDPGDGGQNLIRNASIFTWRNLSYIVKTPSGNRKLLNNVSGFVRPGMLGKWFTCRHWTHIDSCRRTHGRLGRWQDNTSRRAGPTCT